MSGSVIEPAPPAGSGSGAPSAPFRVDVVTIFPEYLAPLRQSLLGKAAGRGLVSVGVHDLRQWTDDAHRTVDDAPFGGGPAW